MSFSITNNKFSFGLESINMKTTFYRKTSSSLIQNNWKKDDRNDKKSKLRYEGRGESVGVNR